MAEETTDIKDQYREIERLRNKLVTNVQSITEDDWESILESRRNTDPRIRAFWAKLSREGNNGPTNNIADNFDPTNLIDEINSLTPEQIEREVQRLGNQTPGTVSEKDALTFAILSSTHPDNFQEIVDQGREFQGTLSNLRNLAQQTGANGLPTLTAELASVALASLESQPAFAILQKKELQDLVDTLFEVGPQFEQQQFDLEQRFAPQRADLLNQILSGQGRDLKDIERQLFPNEARIRDAFGNQVAEDLLSGGRLGPELDRQITQDIRGAQTARGTAFGPSAITSEAITKGRFREELKRNRQAAAQNFLQTSAATQLDPITALLGGNVTRTGTPPASVNPVQGLTPQLLQSQEGLSEAAFNLEQLKKLKPSSTDKFLQGLGAVAGVGSLFF